MPIFLDIFVYLQGFSTTYPLISGKVMKEQFLAKIHEIDFTSVTGINLENIMIECIVQNKLAGKGKKSVRLGDVNFNRAVFLEFIVRVAIYMYTSKQAKSSGAVSSANVVQENKEEEFKELTISQAFYVFYEAKIKPFYEKIDFTPNRFREEELWTLKIEKIYTVNEAGIKALFDKYAVRGSPWMELDGCQRMIRESVLEIDPELVHKAFIMSKQVVVNERDEKQAKTYARLVMVEFLEFFARLANLNFMDSEMKDIELDEKIEYTLVDLLPLVDYELQWNRIAIYEISDSDEDY